MMPSADYLTPTNAIVSLLDDTHTRRVHALWGILERELGIPRIAGEASIPHFTYHGAQDYDLADLERMLKITATRTAAFTVQTSGIGIFNVKDPVVYIPVARHGHINALHSRLWTGAAASSTGVVGHYDPASWLPHITLAYHKVTRENVADVVRYLAEHDFQWEIEVTNLALLYHKTGESEVRFRFDLLT